MPTPVSFKFWIGPFVHLSKLLSLKMWKNSTKRLESYKFIYDEQSPIQNRTISTGEGMLEYWIPRPVYGIIICGRHLWLQKIPRVSIIAWTLNGIQKMLIKGAKSDHIKFSRSKWWKKWIIVITSRIDYNLTLISLTIRVYVCLLSWEYLPSISWAYVLKLRQLRVVWP